MPDKTKTDRIFPQDSLPPLFGENFSSTASDWKRLSGIEFEKVGRILICHLLIEHHINKLIELRGPSDFDWDESRLTFSQKIKLMRKDHAFREFDFIKGIQIINKLRNKFAHSLEFEIQEKDVLPIVEIINEFRKKHSSDKPMDFEHSTIATIEEFTGLFCAYFAGYCTSLLKERLNLKAILNKSKKTDSEK